MRTARLPTLRVLVASVVVGWVPTPWQVPCPGGGYPPGWISSPVEYSPPLVIVTLLGYSYPRQNHPYGIHPLPMGYSAPAYSPTGILIPQTKSPLWNTPPPYGILSPSILTHWDTQSLDIPPDTHPFPIGYAPPEHTPWDTDPPPFQDRMTDIVEKIYLHATIVADGKYLGQNHVPNRRQTLF